MCLKNCVFWIYCKLNNKYNNIESELKKSKIHSHTSLAFSPIEIHCPQISNPTVIYNYRITHVCSTIKLPLHVVNCTRVQQQKAWPELVRLQFFSFLDFRFPLNICSFRSLFRSVSDLKFNLCTALMYTIELVRLIEFEPTQDRTLHRNIRLSEWYNVSFINVCG